MTDPKPSADPCFTRGASACLATGAVTGGLSRGGELWAEGVSGKFSTFSPLWCLLICFILDELVEGASLLYQDN